MMMKAWMVVSFNDKTFAYCLYCNSDNNPMPTDDIYMDFYTCIITNFTLLQLTGEEEEEEEEEPSGTQQQL